MASTLDAPVRTPRVTSRRRLAAALLLPLLLVALGCSFSQYRRAQIAEQNGDWDQAVLDYMELVARRPDDLGFRTDLSRAKMHASQMHFEAGKKLAEAGALERALLEYRQAVELDPTNQYAATELGHVRDAIAARERQQGELKTIDEMKKEAQERSQPPLLEPRSKAPISLEFPNAVSIKDIYKALGKAFGINILFDPNLKDQEISIELKDVTAQDALEIMMRAANHFYKVLDPHTILVAADTPQNRRAYEDLVIQTFYLSNSDVKDVMTMLRTLVDSKKIASNERLNAIILRDSIDRVKVAEKLIQTNDKARAEVVVDVELLQVNSQKIRDIGMNLSQYQISQSLNSSLDADDKTTGTQISVADLPFLNRNSWTLTIPSFVYNFVKTNGDAQVLARPQLRISEGEKAALLIGDRVPIPTTTFNTSNTVGSNVVPITSFQYQDVGIKINIEPRVHHNLEVTLKMHVEISNLGAPVSVGNGQEQPTISTRSVDTVIRLKDGETNFLAGLLRTDEANAETGIPGLSDIPVLGRLFSRDVHNTQRTDVILTMTPHIIRRSDISESDLMPIWVGTEQNITFRGGSPRTESDVEGPFDEGSSAADRVRELIRQRVQELPPGLEEGGAEEEGVEAPVEEEPQGQPTPPPGTNLVPPSFPETPPQQQPVEEPTPPPPQGGQAALSDDAPPPETLAAVRTEGNTTIITPASLEAAAKAAQKAARTTAAPVTVADVDDESAAEKRTPAKVRLRWVPAAAMATVGDTFDLRLDADAHAPLSHLPLILVYDPNVVEPVNWQRGDLLGGDGEAELLGAVSSPGKLLLGVSRLGDRPGVTGHGPVVLVTFKAKAAGTTTIRLQQPKAMGPALEALTPVAASTAKVRITAAESDKPHKDGPDA